MKAFFAITLFLATSIVSAQSSKIEVHNFETKKRTNIAVTSTENLIQASSSCPGGVNISYTDIKMSGGCAGVIERTYLLRDQCNNELTKIQYITLIDENPPVFTYTPEDIVLADKAELATPYSLIADDDSGEPVIMDVAETYDNSDPAFVKVLRTYSATDVCGNVATYTQTISISTARGN